MICNVCVTFFNKCNLKSENFEQLDLEQLVIRISLNNNLYN